MKTYQPVTSNVSNIRGVIKARDAKLHISSIMLLHIVDHLAFTNNRAFIGEIHGFYKANRRDNQKDAINYTHSGVGSMLRTLKNRGYLSVLREGRHITYKLTNDGVQILDGLRD